MEKYLQQDKSDCLKVVLFGPESTGKSSLAKELADHYNTSVSYTHLTLPTKRIV